MSRTGRAIEGHQIQSPDRQPSDLPQLQEHDAGIERIAGRRIDIDARDFARAESVPAAPKSIRHV
jgi:hypothetical protein